MAQTTTQILLPQTPYTQADPNVYGDKKEAAGYYIANKNLQTLTWNLTNVTGTVLVQASLATDPQESDWFAVYSLPCNGLTQTSFYNLTGNFVWIRAAVINFTQGVVQYIKVSY